MLDTEELDIVSVCTYTVDPTGHDLHTEITLYCIEKGIKCVRIRGSRFTLCCLVSLAGQCMTASGVVREACGCVDERR